MRFLSILLTLFIGVTSYGDQTITKKFEVVSNETVELANGVYELKTVCIWSTSHSDSKSREYCIEHSSIINMLSTENVMVSSSCNPAPFGRCSAINAYLLRTRMSTF